MSELGKEQRMNSCRDILQVFALLDNYLRSRHPCYYEIVPGTESTVENLVRRGRLGMPDHILQAAFDEAGKESER